MAETHVNYPHEPGYLYDCQACEARCHCTPGHAECVYGGEHDGTAELEVVFTEDPFTITWNGSATFSVYHHGREVNVFTNYDVTTPEDAQQVAREWWADYGREGTLDVLANE